MLIGAAVGLGLSGMMRGINRVDSAGTTIAQSGVSQDTESISRAMIEQKIGEIEVKASANVVKTADKMIGTIINIRV